MACGRVRWVGLTLLALLFLLPASVLLRPDDDRLEPAPVPVHFEKNVGQYAQQIQFVARGGVPVALDAGGATWPFGIAVRYADGRAAAAEPGVVLGGTYSHFVGAERADWVSHAPTYDSVRHADVWPGIDVIWHGPGLKFDLVVAPGADVAQARFQVEGATVALAEDALTIVGDAGEVRKAAPVAYQGRPDAPTPVAVRYVVDGNVFSFDVGRYDRAQELVVDPLIYSSYLGGGQADTIHAVAYGPQGSFYVTGYTLSPDFPMTLGAYGAPAPPALAAVYVAKFDANRSLVYGAIVDGASSDQPWGIDVDAAGAAYVAGATTSANFPVTLNAAQTSFGGTTDHFVFKLSPDGGTLVYSTFIGGSGQDNGRDVAVDARGRAYVVGDTKSVNMPTTTGHMTVAPDVTNGFLARVSPDGQEFEYATYVGGTGNDVVTGVAVDAAFRAFVTGSTASSDLPVPATAWQPVRSGTGTDTDAFVLAYDPDGTSILWGSYLGGAQPDAGMDAAVDARGDVYVVGSTQSAMFPTTPGALAIAGTGSDAFAAKFDGNGVITYAARLGGVGTDEARRVAALPDGRAVLVGIAGGTGFPTTSMAFQPNAPAAANAFVTMIYPDGSALVNSTYLGGSMADTGWGVAIDADCHTLSVGHTTSVDYPIAGAAYQSVAPAGLNGFMTMLFECRPPVSAFAAAPQPVCHRWPLTFTFLGTPGYAEAPVARAMWDLGDGTWRNDTPPAPLTHAYDAPGTYAVELTTFDIFGWNSSIRQDVVVVNCPPRLGPLADWVVMEGERIAFTATGSDPNRDAIAYAIIASPPGATFNTTTGAFEWSTQWGQAGRYLVGVQVIDIYGMTDIQWFTITVQALPEVHAAPPVQADADGDGMPDGHDACPAEWGDACAGEVAAPIATPTSTPSPVPGCQDILARSPMVRMEEGAARITWMAPPCPVQRFLVWNGTQLLAVVPFEPGRVAYAAVDVAPWSGPHVYHVQSDGDGHDLRRAVETNAVEWCPACAQATVGGDAPKAEATAPVPRDAGWLVVPLVVAVLVAVLAWRLRWVMLTVLVRATSRLDRDDLLEHPLRAQILQLVSSEPGIHDKELIRRLGRGRGVARYHTRRLAIGGLLREHRSAGYTCYFPPDVVDARIRAAGSALRSPVARRLLREVVGGPGRSVPQLADTLGVDASTVSYHLKRFDEVGLLQTRDRGQPVFPNELAGAAVAALSL